ncbi:MAG: hypothetical protein IPP62_14950 [bacterium]|nr:hypothetical protein [bacterium]
MCTLLPTMVQSPSGPLPTAAVVCTVLSGNLIEPTSAWPVVPLTENNVEELLDTLKVPSAPSA